MKILAIETSHDDTSLALYQDYVIIEEISLSQTSFHQQFGGTVPEYAARLHAQNLGVILDQMLKKHKLNDLDYIAYTNEPGLIGSLQMGRLFAFGVALALNIPLIPINHMHAHIFAVAFTHQIKYPAVALIVSGGHSQLWFVQNPRQIKFLGQTKDDAVGEVYDKIARAMNLGFPGGPLIDKLAATSKNAINFKLKKTFNYDFSFSGIKTQVLNYLNKYKLINLADVACGFQEAIIENLIFKIQLAIKNYHPRSLILGGGVAANSALRKAFGQLQPCPLIPDLKYTTDNASMIAITAHLIKETNLIDQ